MAHAGYDEEGALSYFKSGGLGETIGFVEMSKAGNFPKIQMDTDMAAVLLKLAAAALHANLEIITTKETKAPHLQTVTPPRAH